MNNLIAPRLNLKECALVAPSSQSSGVEVGTVTR